ncbi:MAG: hypothetical protein MRQ13_01640 [Candidatus Midichloria sp.]|nr:hypothetical protein [Candidatus Midichloria sp.]
MGHSKFFNILQLTANIMPKISASILSADFSILKDEIMKLEEAGAEIILQLMLWMACSVPQYHPRP